MQGTAGAPTVMNDNPHALGRCGYGPRLPMLVISPWAQTNFVDHTVTDQSSIIHFIEDTWLNGKRIGDGSFDALANSITQMFDFDGRPNFVPVYLDPQTGQPIGPSVHPFPPFPYDGHDRQGNQNRQ
jgi:phospholipase C